MDENEDIDFPDDEVLVYDTAVSIGSSVEDIALFSALSEELQADTRYVPSPEETKIAFAMITPGGSKDPRAICKMCNVSINNFYKITLRKGFQLYFRELLHRAMGVRMHEIIETSFKSALTVDGFQDRKMLLQIGGYFNPYGPAKEDDKVEETAAEIIESRLRLLKTRNAPKEGDIVVG